MRETDSDVKKFTISSVMLTQAKSSFVVLPTQ